MFVSSVVRGYEYFREAAKVAIEDVAHYRQPGGPREPGSDHPKIMLSDTSSFRVSR